METFGVDDSPGSGRYEGGLLTLPDGSVRGIETVARIGVRAGSPGLQEGLQDTTRAIAGSVRDALGARAGGLSLPLRLAVSTMRAGFGAIEEELRPREAVRVEIGFRDGTTLLAAMSARAAELLRRDAEIARGVLARAGAKAATLETATPEIAPDTAPDEALTSIFRYEKRNGRLRRVVAGKPES